MSTSRPNTELPADAITLRTYDELDLYLSKFASRELDLVILLGRPGTGKTESVKRCLGVPCRHDELTNGATPVLYVEGHARPYGLYRQLFQCRNWPVVLDDLDRLYADAACVRLLKPLCSGTAVKRISWMTNATAGATDTPPTFHTTSTVLLIANEWRSLNANVRALEDRAIILHFDPPNAEVHRRVSRWFDDEEVYTFIAAYLPNVAAVSMRHYEKGHRLRRAGLTDWRTTLLQMLLPRPELAVVAALQRDPRFRSDKERVEQFIDVTGRSRPTYYRLKGKLVVGSSPV
jgi:hypothetical protein